MLFPDPKDYTNFVISVLAIDAIVTIVCLYSGAFVLGLILGLLILSIPFWID